MTFAEQVDQLLARWRDELHLEHMVASEIGAIIRQLARTRQEASDRLIRLAMLLREPPPQPDHRPPFSESDIDRILNEIREQSRGYHD